MNKYETYEKIKSLLKELDLEPEKYQEIIKLLAEMLEI